MSSIERGGFGSDDYWLPLNLWEQALERLDVSLVAMDPEGRLTRFNEVAERISGYDRREVIGRSAVEVLMAPEERAASREVIDRLRAEPSIHRMDTQWMTKEGRRRRVRCVSASHRGFERNGKSGRSRIVALGVDVANERRLEREEKKVKGREIDQRKISALASGLAGAAMMAVALTEKAESGEAVTADEMRQLTGLVRRITNEVHELLTG